MQIKTKLPIYYATIGLIVTIGLVYVFSGGEKLITQNIENNFSYIATSKSSEIDKYIYEQLTSIRGLASNNSIIQALNSLSSDKKTSASNIRDVVENFLVINKTFYYSEFLNKNGEVIEGAEVVERNNSEKSFAVREGIQKRIGKSDSQEEYFKNIISELEKSPDKSFYKIEEAQKDLDGNMYINFIVPIYKNNDDTSIELVGILKSRLSLDHINNFLNEINIGTTGNAIIYDKNLNIVSSLNQRELFIKFDKNKASLEKYSKSTFVQNEVQDGEDILSAYKLMDGYKSFNGLGWTLKITQKHSELFSAMTNLKTGVALTIGFIILSVLFLATIIQWQFINPLQRVLKKVQEFTSGDENVKIEVETNDELGVLAGAFNDMIYKIKEKTKILSEYRNIIDATALVSKVDKEGNFIYVNDIFCDSAGCEYKEILGKPHQMIRHPDVSPEVFKDIEKTMKAKEIWKGVMKNQRKDGSEYWLQSVIAPILDMNNNIIEMIMMETDITELEKTKHELEESYSKLQESTESLVLKERISKEFELASKIQEDFMPRPDQMDIEGVEVHCGITSATEIGGDLYDIVTCKDNPSRTIFYIGDVTGHGLIAGIMMAICNSLVYNLAQNCVNSIKDILIKLNSTLFEKLPSKVFITLLMLEYNAKTQKFSYAGAGHERLLVYRKEKDEVEEIKTGGSAIGMFKDASKDVIVNELKLNTGDVVLLYTDGIPEARNNNNEFYGMDKFKESFKSNAHRTVQAMYESILKDLYDFINGAEILDDITLFLIRKK